MKKQILEKITNYQLFFQYQILEHVPNQKGNYLYSLPKKKGTNQ